MKKSSLEIMLIILFVLLAVGLFPLKMQIVGDPILWDSCDSLSTSQGRWYVSQPNTTLSIGTTDIVEGAGCINLDIQDEWAIHLAKYYELRWNLVATPIIRFRLKASAGSDDARFQPVSFAIQALEDGILVDHSYGQLTYGTDWETINIDLRQGTSDFLSDVRQLKWWWNYEATNRLNGQELKLDFIEVGMAEGTVEPLTVDITPSQTSITSGTSATFSTTVQGGITPYSYQWHLDGDVLDGETSSSLTLTPSSTGTFTLSVTLTDAVATTASDTASLTVTEAPVGATTYQLTVEHTAGGTTNPEANTYTFDEGATVTLMATPEVGYVFLYWEIDSEHFNETSVTLTMTKDSIAKAYFETISEQLPTSPPVASPLEGPQFAQWDYLEWLIPIVALLGIIIILGKKRLKQK